MRRTVRWQRIAERSGGAEACVPASTIAQSFARAIKGIRRLREVPSVMVTASYYSCLQKYFEDSCSLSMFGMHVQERRSVFISLFKALKATE